MNEAIKLAIEKGGYGENCNLTVSERNAMIDGKLRHQVIVLDPLFWQALGKVLNWNMKRCDFDSDIEFQKEIGKTHPHPELLPKIAGEYANCSHCHFGANPSCRQHIFEALHYMEIKLTNGNEEEFWLHLLK